MLKEVMEKIHEPNVPHVVVVGANAKHAVGMARQFAELWGAAYPKEKCREQMLGRMKSDVGQIIFVPAQDLVATTHGIHGPVFWDHFALEALVAKFLTRYRLGGDLKQSVAAIHPPEAL